MQEPVLGMLLKIEIFVKNDGKHQPTTGKAKSRQFHCCPGVRPPMDENRQNDVVRFFQFCRRVH